jgi:hypothetical protein
MDPERLVQVVNQRQRLRLAHVISGISRARMTSNKRRVWSSMP